jgi:phage baseplate assembly protein W
MSTSNLPMLRSADSNRNQTIARPDRRWWNFDGVTNPQVLSTLYSIGIMDLRELRYANRRGLSPAASTPQGDDPPVPAVYQFTIPPQSYELAEPTTTQVIATQDGGKFVESHGSLFKDIRIAGTVGLRPRPIAVGSYSGLELFGGPTLSVPGTTVEYARMRDNRGLDPKEVTGFDDLIFLRNLFRDYSDIKNDPALARVMGMVWTTVRDAEAWVVEPVSFTTSRDRSNPLSWRYAIQLRTLYLLDSQFSYVKDTVGSWQKSKNIIAQIHREANNLATAINQLAGAINWAACLPANSLQSVLNTISKVLSALANTKNSIQDFGKNLSKVELQQAGYLSLQMKILFDEQYPQPTQGATDPSRWDGLEEPWSQEGVAVTRNCLSAFQRGCEMIAAADWVWEQTRQTTVVDYAKAYLNSRQEEPFTAGSPLALSNMRLPQAAQEVLVGLGDDIRGLAKKWLGDEAKWKQLVILNNLRPPYIGSSSGSGILGPGDKILIPKDSESTPNTGVTRALNSDAAMEAQSQVLRRYGRDLRMVSSATDPSLSDLGVNARGDLDVVEGLENVEQGIMIKFATEQGELATHPEFGARYPLGTKVNQTTLQEFSINVRRTLLSDPRVAHVSQLKISTEGDKIITNAKVDLADSDAQLPISFVVRS